MYPSPHIYLFIYPSVSDFSYLSILYFPLFVLSLLFTTSLSFSLSYCLPHDSVLSLPLSDIISLSTHTLLPLSFTYDSVLSVFLSVILSLLFSLLPGNVDIAKYRLETIPHNDNSLSVQQVRINPQRQACPEG